ncbi:aminotransferase class V-fold PLP-dependent enzyme [Allorhodopirellula solitaria]|uniref:cysteine desulfurase n=1 Tax=Allorhodopirellula solitaria TaxID=2527987 RepID=A0A5C5XQ28_9BACT|nr:aminotransferase class V-fold PLP-dependent enzyme [Allorhodopirellula solitaria]TWT65020.1 putative cysteine desulfurase [Allorhodopirellula solitaria]
MESLIAEKLSIVTRIYLDHASTSWPKAAGVIDAMTEFMRDCGANSSRGNYASARQAATIRERVRGRLAELIGAEGRQCVSFHSGCTAALNAAIHGLMPATAGSQHHVIASSAEHNSVLRPLRQATRRSGTELEIIRCEKDGSLDADTIVGAINARTRMVALTDASNVTGIRYPVAEVGRRIALINASRSSADSILLLCDAAQTFGSLPINVASMGAHVLAAPAHKGSGGPLGIAMLYLHPSLHERIEPTIQGGSGHDGLADRMPASMPGRLEPGSMNIAALAGWDAALDRQPTAPETWHALTTRLHNRLSEIDGVHIVGGQGVLPIASIEFGAMLSCAEAAAILDAEFGIEVRSGYHCAAELHDCLGTRESGTLRISCGPSTTLDEIDRLADALAEIVES